MHHLSEDQGHGAVGADVIASATFAAPRAISTLIQASAAGTWRLSKLAAQTTKPMGTLTRLIRGGLDKVAARKYGVIEGRVINVKPTELPGYSAMEVEQRLGDRLVLAYVKVPATAQAGKLQQATRLFLLEATMTAQAITALTEQDRLRDRMQSFAPNQQTAAKMAAIQQHARAAQPAYVVTESGDHIETTLIGFMTEHGERVSLMANGSQAAMPLVMFQYALYAGAILVCLPLFFLVFPIVLGLGMAYFGYTLGRTARLVKAVVAECEDFIRSA